MSLKKQFSKSKCKVTFTLPKQAVEGAKNVKVLGEFNEWDPKTGVKMKAMKNEFKAIVELPVGRDYQFRYLINDTIWENDWNADNYVATPYGVDNSVVFVREGMTTRKPVNASTVTKKKSTTKATTKTKKDNLKKIEGIGPKIEKMFNEAGITTFSILSKTKVSSLKQILKAAGSRYTMHDPTTWPKQAKMAANGEWDKLTVWQDELKGGK